MSAEPLTPDECAEFEADLDTWIERENERQRLWRLYLRGELKPSLTSDERAEMRRAYFAKGGQVTRVPEGKAEGSDVGRFWPVARPEPGE